jgi:transposase
MAGEAQQARGPPGQTRGKWTPGRDMRGAPVIRLRLDRAPWRPWPPRQRCTAAQAAPRQRTVRPPAHPAATQAARQRQGTPEFKEKYALRAGGARSLSQGSRCFDLRQSRYDGCARTHLQQLLTATAMQIVRGIAWVWEEPVGERRRWQPGPFVRLASHPLSRQAVLC